MIEFFIGIILGIIFFGGLYWTVLKLNYVKYPSLLIMGSFLLRMAVLLLGLYFISKNGYKGVLFALLGIIVLKFVMIFTMKKPKTKNNEVIK
jgi:F1F0 ATPase subunit 2